MASFVSPELRATLDQPVVVMKEEQVDGRKISVNLLSCPSFKHMGQIVQKPSLHVQVLLGEQGYEALCEQMNELGVCFGMDVGDWEPPGINQAYVV